MVASLVTTGPTAPDIPLPELLRRQSTHWAPAAGPFISGTCDFNCLIHTQLFTENTFLEYIFQQAAGLWKNVCQVVHFSLTPGQTESTLSPQQSASPRGRHTIELRAGREGWENVTRDPSPGESEKSSRRKTLYGVRKDTLSGRRQSSGTLPASPPTPHPPTPVPFSQAHREDR